MRAIRWRSWVAGSLVLFAGCSTGDRDGTSVANAPEASAANEILNVRVGRTLDPDIRHAVAFHRVNDAWTGGFVPYTATVNSFGELAFRGHPMTPPTGKVARRDRSLRPITKAGAEVRFNTVSARRGDVELTTGVMDVRETDGEIAVQRGTVREVIANAPNGVEQLWEFDGKPTGDGDLVVAVQAAGVAYAGTNERGLELKAGDGTGVIYGQATWIDGNNVRTNVETRWANGRIEVRVPRALVESSAYPAALDPLVMASNTSDSTYAPDTAAVGTSDLVVWENYSAGYPNLRFSIIDNATGQTGAAASKAVSTTSFQAEPATAAAGSGFVTVWRDTRTGVSNIRLTRITTTGAAGGEIAVASSGTDQFSPDVACATVANCLVVWHEGPSGSKVVRGSIVNPQTGSAGAAFTISGTVATGTDQGAAAVGTDGTNYFVAWETAPAAGSTSSADVLGVNVSSAGAVSGSVLSVAATANDEYAAAVGYDGSSYYVGYTQFNTDEDAFAQRVTPGGGLSGSAITISAGAGDQGYPNFARNGSTLLAAYYSSANIAAAPITAGSVGSSFTISSAANEQDTPRAAFGSGTYYYVVYNNNTVVANLPTTKATWKAMGTRATSSAAVAPEIDLATVSSPTCDAVTVSFNPASPQTVGTTVSVNAAATCTGGATAQYEFWLYNGSTWSLGQAYSTANVFNWNTTGYAGTTYAVQVRTRHVGSTATYEAVTSGSYTLTGGSGLCSSVTASASPMSPQAVGTTVTVTANATCSNNETPQYEFYLYTSAGWHLVQSYGPSSTWNWNTTGYGGFTYSVLVRTRRSGSTAAYESQTSFSYTLTGGSGVCSALTATASPTSPQPSGTTVTLTGAATCTSGATPEYEFYVLPPGGYWTLVQGYSTSPSASWRTTGLASGTYAVQFRTRAVGSSADYDANAGMSYVLQ